MLESKFITAKQSGSKNLLVVLHGLGDSMDGYTWLPDALGIGDLNYLLLNAPDPYFTGFSWYDIYGDAEPGLKRSRTLLAQLLDKLASDGIPYENIALFGFSQGCVVSVETALTFPKPLAGVIGVSGYIHSSEELIDTLNPKDPSDKEGAQDSNRRPTPAAFIQKLLITHGAHDPLIPIGHARRLFGRLIEKGVNLQWRELHKDHTIVEEVEIPLFREFLKSSFPAERK